MQLSYATISVSAIEDCTQGLLSFAKMGASVASTIIMCQYHQDYIVYHLSPPWETRDRRLYIVISWPFVVLVVIYCFECSFSWQRFVNLKHFCRFLWCWPFVKHWGLRHAKERVAKCSGTFSLVRAYPRLRYIHIIGTYIGCCSLCWCGQRYDRRCAGWNCLRLQMKVVSVLSLSESWLLSAGDWNWEHYWCLYHLTTVRLRSISRPWGSHWKELKYVHCDELERATAWNMFEVWLMSELSTLLLSPNNFLFDHKDIWPYIDSGSRSGACSIYVFDPVGRIVPDSALGG